MTKKLNQCWGVFGGTFDPIHLGHLQLVQTIIDQNICDKILIIPNASPPHKEESSMAPYIDRVNMIRISINQNPKICIDEVENDEDHKNFTIDTLRILKKKYPDIKLFFILGLDNIYEICRWKDSHQLIMENHFLLVLRKNVSLDSNRINQIYTPDEVLQLTQNMLDFYPPNISSSEIKKMIKEGQSIVPFVGKDIAHYIMERRLYFDK